MPIPKYKTIAADIERRLHEGEWSNGDKLPAIRQLATQYTTTKTTITAAYKWLEQRHLVYSVAQSGYYVVQKPIPDAERSPIVNYSSALPDRKFFPYEDFRHCLNQAIDVYKADLFEYGTERGLPSFIKEIRRLLTNHQLFVDDADIMITTGVQQALSILTTMPFPSGKEVILIEEPAYHILIALVQTMNIPFRTVRRTLQGLDMEQLEREMAKGDVKCFYTTPRFHQPLGTSLTKQQQREVCNLAARYDVYILEDDYLADFGKEDPLFCERQSDHVVYMRSFSKVMFPGLRTGAIVLPKALQKSFQIYKKLHDLDSAMLMQAALAIYLKNGMFERHRQAMLALYEKRMTTLVTELQHARSLTIHSHPSPVHTVATFHDRQQFLQWQKHCQRNNIIVETIDPYTIQRNHPLYVRLNVTNVTNSQIILTSKILCE